jgi:hypothetical protein
MIDLLAQFANTYREWHYLSVGIMAGFLAGYMTRELTGYLAGELHG